ncbi:bifunctional riboflavin kinase/FAD synthetase, partial [bacterium]|nr:bifunctional riboflavin kinase/FAD synthetase [bacterium]
MGEGRPVFSGRVVHGQGRGRALGFPTAHLPVAGSGHLP